MLIARKEKKTHWYTAEGQPFHEILKKDGTGMRAVNIRDAEKLGLYRSVTNVLSVLGKEGLVNWRIEQAIVAALTLPRLPAENEHDFAKRALLDSEVQVIAAADSGVRLHDLASRFLLKGEQPEDPLEARLLAPFMAWCAANVKRCIYSEKVVTNPALLYAGTLDAFVELTEERGYAILDLKTQVMDKDKAGAPKPTFYPEWPIQLAAYKECEALQFWTPSNHRLISIVIGREEVGFASKEWPPDSRHFAAFRAACEVWAYLKNYNPAIPAVAA